MKITFATLEEEMRFFLIHKIFILRLSYDMVQIPI